MVIEAATNTCSGNYTNLPAFYPRKCETASALLTTHNHGILLLYQ